MPTVVASLLFLAAHAVMLAAMAATFFVVGAALLAACGLTVQASVGAGTFGAARDGEAAGPGGGGLAGLELAALALPLGFLLAGQMGLVLGQLGRLRPAPVLAALAAAHFASWRGWRLLIAALRPRRATARFDRQPGGIGRTARVLAGCLLLVAPYALLGFYPPTSFDSTLYHLVYAREFAATGGMPFLPALRYPIFPQLAEVVGAQALLFLGDLATQGLNLIATLGTALLLLVWPSRSATVCESPPPPEIRSRARRLRGVWAAAAYLGCPIVASLSGTAYVEPAMTWLAMAALFAWRRRYRWSGPAPSPAGAWKGADWRWWAMAGALAGGAAAIKYLGLAFVAALAAAALASTLAIALAPAAARARVFLRWGACWPVVALVGGVVVVAGPWYWRLAVATGNPLFPYFPDLFGRSAWVTPEFPGLHALRGGIPRLLVELPRLPWDLVVARWRLGSQPPYSPFFLVLMPLFLLALFRRPAVRALLALAVAYAALVLLVLPQAHYLLPVAPMLALAVGESLSLVRLSTTTAGRYTAIAAALLLLAPGWLYAGWRVAKLGPPPANALARDAYLGRRLPAYPALAYLNRTAGRRYGVYALHAENLAYFAEGAFWGDWSGPASFDRIVPGDGDPRLLSRNLRRLGAGYLLLVHGRASSAPLDPESAAFRTCFREVYDDERASVFALSSCGK